MCVLRRLGVKSYDTQNGSIISIILVDKAGYRSHSVSPSVRQISCFSNIRATRAERGGVSGVNSDKHVAHPQRASQLGSTNPSNRLTSPRQQTHPWRLGGSSKNRLLGVGATTMALAPSQECAYAQSTVTPFVLLRRAKNAIKARGSGLSSSLGTGVVRYCAARYSNTSSQFRRGKRGEVLATATMPKS